MAAVVQTFQDHPFGSVFGLWGTAVAGTLFYIKRRQIPTQLKVIQARMVAQAALIVGVCGLAGMTYMSSSVDKHHGGNRGYKLRDFEVKPESQPAPVAAAEDAAAAPTEAKELK